MIKFKPLIGGWFCDHWWREDLIFGAPPNTHRIIKTCVQCGKGSTVFADTPEQAKEIVKESFEGDDDFMGVGQVRVKEE